MVNDRVAIANGFYSFTALDSVLPDPGMDRAMNRNNVRVMRKERRRDRRRGQQLEARLDGHEVLLTDLSAAGFGAAIDATARIPSSFRVGRRLRLDLIPQDGGTISLPVEISRPVGRNGVFGGVFLELTDDAYNAIESLLTGRFKRR
jgi:hypothetical protein